MSARYVSRSPDVAARQIGDELMIMSGRDSTLFSLNETAAALWDAADGRTTVEGIAEMICEQFEVDPEEALQDTEAMVKELTGHGILVISEKPL